MKKIVRLTESDLVRLVNKVLNEQDSQNSLVKLYDDEKETKFLDGVSLDGKAKRTGFDKLNLEFPAHVIGKNTKGILRISCSVKPRKFYFIENGNNVTVSGFNRKMSESFCSANTVPMS